MNRFSFVRLFQQCFGQEHRVVRSRRTRRLARRLRRTVSQPCELLEQKILLAAPEYDDSTGYLYIEFTAAEATSVTVDAAAPVAGASVVVRVTYSGTGGATVWQENLHPAYPAGVDPSLVANITVFQEYGEDDPPVNVTVNLSGVSAANGFTPVNTMTVNTGNGNDMIFGSAMNVNRLMGNEGNDTILGGARSDLLEGRAGNDSLIGGSGASAGDEINGGSGNDTILSATFDASLPGEDSLEGGNQLNGQDGNDSIIGDSGDDTITGGYGDDTIDSKSGNDNIDAGADNDQVTAALGNDTVAGGAGNDVITTDDGEDVITGGAGNDNIASGAGRDRIVGGGGDDTISGGDGYDNIAGDGDSGFTTNGGEYIPPLDEAPANPGADSLDGGEGYDVISGGPMADTIQAGPGGEVSPGFFAGSLITGGSEVDLIYGSDGPTADAAMDTIYGNGMNDTIYGLGGIDELFGDADYDLIYGGPGNDNIDGGSGNDTLYGEAGQDTLQGQGGYDTLYGGADNDQVLSGGSDPDLINGGAGDDDGFSGGDGDDTLWSGDGAPDEPVADMQGKGDAGCDLEDGRPDGDPGCGCVQIEVTPTTGHVTSETGTTTTFTVSLSHEPADDVTISLTSSNLNEGTVSASSLTFTATTWDSPQTVTVTGVNDGLPDGDQYYDIVFGNAVSTDTLYNGKTHSPISVLNIALPVVSVSATGASETPMFPGMPNDGKFTISRSSSDISAALTVYYTVSGTATPSTDYNALSGTATIPANQASVDVTVTPAADNLIEGSETVVMTLVLSPSYPDYEPGSPNPATLTISEPVYAITLHVDDVTANEDVGNMTFTVTVTPPSGMTYTGALSISYSAGSGTAFGGSDFTPTSGTFSFSNFTGPQTATFTVAVIDDSLDEPTEYFFVSIGLASSNPTVTLNSSDPANKPWAYGTIVDNDDPTPPPPPPMPPAPPTGGSQPPSSGPTMPGATGGDSSSSMPSSGDSTLALGGTGGTSTTTSEATADTINLPFTNSSSADSASSLPPALTDDNVATASFEEESSSDPSVAGQYPNSDSDDAETATTSMATDVSETAPVLGDDLFVVGSGGSDLMELLLLESNISGYTESAPPGTDSSFGENVQLVVEANGGVVVGTLD